MRMLTHNLNDQPPGIAVNIAGGFAIALHVHVPVHVWNLNLSNSNAEYSKTGQHQKVLVHILKHLAINSQVSNGFQ